MDVALERVTRRGRRRRLLRRAAIAAVAAAVVLAAVLVAPAVLRADRDRTPAAPSDTTPTPTTRVRPPIVVLTPPLAPFVGRYSVGLGSASHGLSGQWHLLIPRSGRIHVAGTLDGRRFESFIKAQVDPSTESDPSPVLLIDFLDPDVCGAEASGTYTVGSDGQHLFFSVVHDPCRPRRLVMTLAQHPWFRES